MAREALARLRENLASFDAEVAYELASGGERADLWGEIDVNVEDLRAALSALDQPSGVRVGVKPLDWVSVGHKWYADRYTITRDAGAPDLFIVSGWRCGTNPYYTLEAAKAAAQADYDTRILSALDLSAIGAEGWGTIAVEAALREYDLVDRLAGKFEIAGRHTAVRGMMVRLGLYDEFVAALNDESSISTSSNKDDV